MPKRDRARSFLEQIADAQDPTPKDFDPEDVETNNASDDDSQDNGTKRSLEARQHYAATEKSKLRKPDTVSVGAQYDGSSISRGALEDDTEDEDNSSFASLGGTEGSVQSKEPFRNDLVATSSDSEEYVRKKHDLPAKRRTQNEQGSVVQRKNPVDGKALEDDAHSEFSDNSHTDLTNDDSSISSVEGRQDGSAATDTDSDDSSPPPVQNDRHALRKMMLEEQASVRATMSAAVKADISKGKAIKEQRATFDTLLNVRIKLQKGLVATNTMVTISSDPVLETFSEEPDPVRGAEEAAINLLNTLTSLRSSFVNTDQPDHKQISAHPLKATASTPNSEISSHMIAQENQAIPHRRAIITKWSQRTNPVANLRPQNRLSHAPVQQPLTSILDTQLTGDVMERAVKRTRIARSCAPTQAKTGGTGGRIISEDACIYDDADFYTLLLRELVDSRMADNSSATSRPDSSILKALPSRTELKIKRQVDTKASKGRKLRYTVQEKLQNFMVADDRGSWGERQREELFGSLLGRTIDLREYSENPGSSSPPGKGLHTSNVNDSGEAKFRLFG